MSKFRFYFILLIETVLFPFLLLGEELKKRVNFSSTPKQRNRLQADANKLKVCIHDWAGYNLERTKAFKNGKIIECGLKFQVDRLVNYMGEKQIKYEVTISDADVFGIDKYRNLPIVKVSNIGMDFGGYANFAEKLPEENVYVLLMNTSVEKTPVPFINEYIDFMEKNPDVGLLGISYSTKMYQTFIRNNFIPHVQSFFLLSTSSVLKEVITRNNGFVGKNVNYKRMLIRDGEIALSKVIKKLGYSLAIIGEDGRPFIFPKAMGLFNTEYKQWNMPKGDYRYSVSIPNKINEASNDF
ncbi:MAG: hypothetical protein ACTHNW_04490 [Mucilaginibacter sp.]